RSALETGGAAARRPDDRSLPLGVTVAVVVPAPALVRGAEVAGLTRTRAVVPVAAVDRRGLGEPAGRSLAGLPGRRRVARAVSILVAIERGQHALVDVAVAVVVELVAALVFGAGPALARAPRAQDAGLRSAAALAGVDAAGL